MKTLFIYLAILVLPCVGYSQTLNFVNKPSGQPGWKAITWLISGDVKDHKIFYNSDSSQLTELKVLREGKTGATSWYEVQYADSTKYFILFDLEHGKLSLSDNRLKEEYTLDLLLDRANNKLAPVNDPSVDLLGTVLKTLVLGL